MAPTADQLARACIALSRRDPVLRQAFKVTAIPDWRHADPTYATLARAVVHQLLSVKAAGTIWRRIQDMFEGHVDAGALLATRSEVLRACGLSHPKIRHLQSIAEALESGALCFHRLETEPYPVARRELMAVKGIGPWTADLFLMTAMGQLDAFPEGDVGLMEAYRQISGRDMRHTAQEFTALAGDWRPYRAVAAHLLWAWLNHSRVV